MFTNFRIHGQINTRTSGKHNAFRQKCLHVDTFCRLDDMKYSKQMRQSAAPSRANNSNENTVPVAKCTEQTQSQSQSHLYLYSAPYNIGQRHWTSDIVLHSGRLKRLKTYIRSTISQVQLNNTALSPELCYKHWRRCNHESVCLQSVKTCLWRGRWFNRQ